MPLRDYQSALVDGAREILRSSRSCLIQLPTGAGKTPVVAEIHVKDRILFGNATGTGCELNSQSWKDGLSYLKLADEDRSAPSLFDALDELEGSV